MKINLKNHNNNKSLTSQQCWLKTNDMKRCMCGWVLSVCVCARACTHAHGYVCMWMHTCVQVYMWEHCFRRYNRNHHIWTIQALAVTTTLKIKQQMLHHMCYLSCKVPMNQHIKVQVVFKQTCQHLTIFVCPNTLFKTVKIFIIYNQGHSSWLGVHLVNLAEQWKCKSITYAHANDRRMEEKQNKGDLPTANPVLYTQHKK